MANISSNLLRRHLKKQSSPLTLGVIGLLLAVGSNLALPEVLRRSLNQSSFNGTSELVSIGLIIVGLLCLQALSVQIRSYFFASVGHGVAASLRKELFSTILKRSVSFFDSNSSADLTARTIADISQVQQAISSNLSVIIRYTLQTVFGVILMIVISPLLTTTVVGGLILITGLGIVLGKMLKRKSFDLQNQLGIAQTEAQEAYSSIRTIKSFETEQIESIRFDTRLDSVLEKGKARALASASLQSIVSLLMNLAIVIVVGLGVAQVWNSQMATGDFVAFLGYGLIVATSVAFLTSSFSQAAQGLGALKRIEELFEVDPFELDPDRQITKQSEKVAIQAVESSTTFKTPLKLEFDNVSFNYPTRKTVTVFEQLSFHINQAETVALVGTSGGGKTTIANLLLKFYEPQSGAIKINGRDISSIPTSNIRSLIGIVSQNTEVFSETLRYNLTYGSSNVSDEQLLNTCKEVALDEFIDSLPEGLDTQIGEKGVTLSGGQKQRISIARLLLRNPAIIILDEATSSLDSQVEHTIQQALQKLMRNRTALVIAHRLSTVKNVDRVLVLEQGKIIQEGTHQELYGTDGVYKEMVKKQAIA